eukprot:jgi/Chlat1/479/Chrsp103S00979
MDDLERAVLFSLDHSGAVDPALQQRALLYCQEARASPGAIGLCIERIPRASHPAVRFWCLQTLQELLPARYSSLSDAERSQLQTCLLRWIQDERSLCQPLGVEVQDATLEQEHAPAYVRNKLAQVFATVVGIDYPERWPAVFLDLAGGAVRTAFAADMFCRAMMAVDDEIIAVDPRVGMRVKDAIREQCVMQVLDAWYTLLSQYHTMLPDLAGQVLQTMQRYISWMDINLIASDRFMVLLFQFLSASHVKLRIGACDCLMEVVGKRMDAISKLAMLQRLQMASLCSRMPAVQDLETAQRLTLLITELAQEVLDCEKHLDADVTQQAAAVAANNVNSMLEELFPGILFMMEHVDDEVSSSTFQFLQSYATKLKKDGSVSAVQAEHMAKTLVVLGKRMRYQEPYDTLLNEPDNRRAEDYDEEFQEYRRTLFTLLRNISRVIPDITRSFVQSNLTAVLSTPDSSARDVEAAIMLLYQLGEGMAEEALKAGSGALADMVGALVSATVPCHIHRLVAAVYLETVVRYVRFLQQQPQYIPGVLAVFLDSRGLRHAHSSVRSRGGYLFMRLVKTLRQQLRPYAEQIFKELQLLIEQGFSAASSAKARAAELDERIYVFEALGLLAGMDDLPEERQSAYVASILVPLCSQMDRLLTESTLDQAGSAGAVQLLQSIILATTSLSKGFGEQLATGKPKVGNLFRQALEQVLRVLQTLPQVKALRGKVISFVHRMVDCLGTSLFPYLPVAIQQLLLDSEVRDVLEFIQLMNQIMSKFKAAILPIVQELLPAVVSRVYALLPPVYMSNAEEARESRELQRGYFTFLSTIAANDLLPVFLTEPIVATIFPNVTAMLLQGAATHPDPAVRKTCVTIFARFIAEWCPGPGQPEQLPGFKRYAIEEFATKCCVQSPFAADFDFHDANTLSLLGELASVHKLLYQKCGEEYLQHLVTSALPAVNCPPALATQYAVSVQTADLKDLRRFMQHVSEQTRPQANGTTSVAPS